MVLKEECRMIPRTGNGCEPSQKKRLTINDSGADNGEKGITLGSGYIEFAQKNIKGHSSSMHKNFPILSWARDGEGG